MSAMRTRTRTRTRIWTGWSCTWPNWRRLCTDGPGTLCSSDTGRREEPGGRKRGCILFNATSLQSLLDCKTSLSLSHSIHRTGYQTSCRLLRPNPSPTSQPLPSPALPPLPIASCSPSQYHTSPHMRLHVRFPPLPLRPRMRIIEEDSKISNSRCCCRRATVRVVSTHFERSVSAQHLHV
jgi:hypothetical protein